MRIADPRIRLVARAIGYHDGGRLHPARQPDDYEDRWRRKYERQDRIRAAVRVLDTLDGDIIDEWEEEYSDRIGIGIVEWADLRGLPDPPERVHVTVRRTP